MNKFSDIQKVKILEIITILASLVGILLVIIHGNIYDYFFNLFSIKDFFNFRMLYVSLLVYSILALVIFVSIYWLDEKNPVIRFFNYVQAWLFITLAAGSYEWFNNMIVWGSQIVFAGHLIESPYNFYTKRASVIVFGALFVIWIIERKKSQIRNSKPL